MDSASALPTITEGASQTHPVAAVDRDDSVEEASSCGGEDNNNKQQQQQQQQG